ncbi:Phage-related minor tail protein [Rhodoferax sp. OV413]|uniref:phage tail tape measure protein n=1 Tax=Rhodoferax sp. OV413 TaxID=1855285 RepID=UPI00088F5D32|nr:phage tail tape measure protein [Rhodoferax sp. OV413]SDO76113.1 Phage-related minor tail protein [Rhodoferax sp. OV413]
MDFAVGVRLFGNSAGLAKAAAEAMKALNSLNMAGAAGAKSTAKATASAAASMRSEYQRMAQAREALGIRSERRVQQEILQTQAAYRRLAESGTMSWNEQRRAAAAMHKQVRDLNNEMGRLTGRQKLAAGGRSLGLVAAGVAAGGAVLAPKVRVAMDYELRMANMANTAFSGRDTAGRKAGMKDLDLQVQDAVRYGGGTRDGAADTLDALLASGAFNPGQTAKIFREAVMAGTANNADPTAFAQMAITANKTMGIAPEQMGRIFGMGTYAGQAGGFEVRDMAKWLPQQMAAAKAVGLYGEAGFAKLAAVNQAAVNTAGTRDEAGNNVVNLLAKLGSQDTNKDFKKQGIDLPRMLAEGRMKGQDAFDVVGGLLDSQLGKSKNYQAVQKQLATAKGGDRQAALEAVGNIAQGTVIGKVFQDRQALMALYGFMQDRKRVGEITAGALGNTDAASRNMDLIRGTGAFSAQQWQNERDIANQNAMNGLTPAIKGVTDQVVGLMQTYPGYTTAIAGATTAVTALAAAAGAAALAQGLLGGAGAAGMAGRLGGMATRFGGAAGRAGLVGLAGAAGYGAGSLISSGIEGTSVSNSIGEVIARTLAVFGNQEAAQAVAVTDAFKNSRVGGEITVRVLSDPSVAVQNEVKPFNGTRMNVRSDVGRTNPESSW